MSTDTLTAEPVTPTVQVSRRLTSRRNPTPKIATTVHALRSATEDDLFVTATCGLYLSPVGVGGATGTSVTVFREVQRDVTCKRCLRSIAVPATLTGRP
jgi:putative intracellular protease/amidase